MLRSSLLLCACLTLISVAWAAPITSTLLDVNARHHVLHPKWLSLEDAAQLRLQEETVQPYCGVITNTTEGYWGLDNFDEPRLHLKDCQLRRPTVTQARQCLHSQSLLFIGDSISRYQYISLVVFMKTGRWPEKFGSVPDRPSPLIETEWPSWTAFFDGALDTCSCSRNSSEQDDWYERRHYHGHHVTLRSSFFPIIPSMEAGFSEIIDEWTTPNRTRYSYTAHINKPQMCNSTTSSQHPSCDYSDQWNPTTVLIANTGLWRNEHTGSPNYFLPIKTAPLSPHLRRAFWRTTTPRRNGNEMHPGSNEVQRSVFGQGDSKWELLDLFKMFAALGAREAYWDGFHFLPFLYQEMNIYLLNVLCDMDWTFVDTAPEIRPGDWVKAD